jgi:hypothetical protein
MFPAVEILVAEIHGFRGSFAGYRESEEESIEMWPTLSDDLLAIMLTTLDPHDVAAFAVTCSSFCEVVRRLAATLFPNAAGSALVLQKLAGGDHMNLRRLQAAIEHVARELPMPHVPNIDQFTLLVQFQMVTYGAERTDADEHVRGVHVATNIKTLYTKWVPLDEANFPPQSDANPARYSLVVDLSNDAVPVRRSDWDGGTSSELFYYGAWRASGGLPAGQTEFVLKLMMHRQDINSAAALFETGHGRSTEVDEDGLDFEYGYLLNETGRMFELKGAERQAAVGVMAHLQWNTDGAHAETCPFDHLSVNFEYDWQRNDPVMGVDGFEGVEGLDRTMTNSFPVMFTYRLLWMPLG